MKDLDLKDCSDVQNLASKVAKQVSNIKSIEDGLKYMDSEDTDPKYVNSSVQPLNITYSPYKKRVSNTQVYQEYDIPTQKIILKALLSYIKKEKIESEKALEQLMLALKEDIKND